MARKRKSVRDQIERTLPSTKENAWYKKFGKGLSPAAAERGQHRIRFRKPRKGERIALHTHTANSLLPSAKDILGFIHQMPYGITTSVIVCASGKRVKGYTIMKAGKNVQLKKMYYYMKEILAEKVPTSEKGKKSHARRIKSALTRYGFNVRIISMPGFAPETPWKQRKKRT